MSCSPGSRGKRRPPGRGPDRHRGNPLLCPYFFSEDDFQFLDGLNAILAAAGAVSLALSAVAGGMLARRIARPVAKAADIAKQIARGNYDIRFEGKSHARELEDLAGAINHLAGVLTEQENLRKRLTTDVAHELRTPLTALSLHLEAMLEGVWEPTPERLASCYEEIARLIKLISDLEQLANAQPENLRLDRAQVDLLDVARGVIRAFEKELHDKGLELELELEGEPCVVYADRDRLSQVMTNLLSNAVKYSKPEGAIRVEVRDEGQVALLAVEDDGIGITATELPFLFERFYRTDKSRSRDTGGAGIGLAIAKAIVQAHGGSIRAESREDAGEPVYGDAA